MARGVNKAILIGNLGQDPELRYTGSGTAVCTFSIATNESYEDRDGNRVERTEWHNIETWGRTAENCNEYLSKGRTVYVEGKMQTDSWEDGDGNTRKTTKIRAFQVQFLGAEGGQQGDGNVQHSKSRNQNGQGRQQEDDTFEPDSDLPF